MVGRRKRRWHSPRERKSSRGERVAERAALRSPRAWRKDAALLTAIVLFAFALRLVYVLQLRSNPQFAYPRMDELYHDQWARAIAAGESFVEGPYFRAPFYPAFLAGVYKVFGAGYLAPRVVQAVLGSLSCGLLFLIGRAVFGRDVGAVAGFAAASYWMLIYFDGELLIPSLLVFLDLWLIWLLLRAARAPGKFTYGVTGVVLGLSAIARPNILLFGPAIVIWIIVMHRKARVRAFTYVAWVTGGCLLAVLPVTVRNYVVGHDQALIASQGGVNFFIGNNAEADGQSATVPGTPGDWWGGYYATIARAERDTGRRLKPSEVSQYYFSQAWDFIRREPGDFLALTLLKLRLFWTRWEISNNKNIYFWTESFTPVVRMLPLGFGLLGPLGILGLALCWRRRVELFPLWGFILVYMVSVVAFFCTARYRVPILPPLILLAVFALFQMAASARRGHWKPIARAVVLLVFAALFVLLTPGAKASRHDSGSYVALGKAYKQQGRLDLAAENYRKALEVDPNSLTAHLVLGILLDEQQRLPEAIAELRRAVAARPILKRGETSERVASAHYNLGRALHESGAYDETIENYRACIALDPSGREGKAFVNLGSLLMQLGRREEGIEVFRQAIEPLRAWARSEPDNPKLLYSLGRALFAQGQYDEALVPLRRCVRVNPTHRRAMKYLSDSLVRLAHYEEAAALLRRALPLGDRDLVMRLAFLLASSPDASSRNGEEAMELAGQACLPRESCGPLCMDTLAAVLAEAGHLAEAADLAQEALQQARRAPQLAGTDVIESLAERLALYEAGEPYRLPSP